MRVLAARKLDDLIELDVERGPIRLTFDNKGSGWGAVLYGRRFPATRSAAVTLQGAADDLFGGGGCLVS